MICAAISWYSMFLIVTMKTHIIAKNFVNILVNHVRPIVEMLFNNGDAFSQDDKEPVYTARIVQDWFSEHEDKL